MQGYSNVRAMRALIRASLQAMLKSPSAIIFSIAFPLIFIIVFGFLGGGSRNSSFHVALSPGTDTTNELYMAMKNMPAFVWEQGDSSEVIRLLKEGDITAIVGFKENTDSTKPRYSVVLNAAPSQLMKMPQLQGLITAVGQSMDPEIQKRSARLLEVDVKENVVREFKIIDFFLPGQLGFSLLAGSVFGTAFVFFNLRQTLVLKRFFATPVHREIIVISEGISRMIFQLMGAAIIISVGYYVFDYTLVNGFTTFMQIMALSALSILVFMGFGFIVSAIAKSDATIPPFANMITLPQFLLAGTFFSIDNFPKWLQPFCRALPLSFVNDAMRKIAFEGASFWDVKTDIIFLLVWGIILYTVAARLFKWE